MSDLLVSMGATLTSLKTVFDLTKLAVDARDAGIAREKLIEVQREIFTAQQNALSAQSDQFALLDRIRALEAKVAELEDWSAKRAQYQLTNLSPTTGALGFTLKEKTNPSEPDHVLCPNCLTNRSESILQKLTKGMSEYMVCLRCKSELVIRKHHPTTGSFRPHYL